MESAGDRPVFLFSIDLEDAREGVQDGNSYKERVPENTYTYLTWLAGHHSKCTFFTTGDVARRYPSLIGEIVAEGHEIACHTTDHIPLDRQTPQGFRKDLEQNISFLMRAGASEIKGFRAPTCSLTEETSWAYAVLKELNFFYSSSVLPAKNPLYGWEGFGCQSKNINGIVEIPITVGKFGPLTIPYGAGVYFRSLPWILIRPRIMKKHSNGLPLTGYFHPYDIDTKQEKYMHAGINNNRFYNWLMYYNRKNVFRRLDRLMDYGFNIIPYHNYVTQS